MKICKLKIVIYSLFLFFIHSIVVGVRTNTGDLKGTPEVPKIESTCKIATKSGNDTSWTSGVLLSPEWVVTVTKREIPPTEVFYTNLDGLNCSSAIDKYIVANEETFSSLGVPFPKELLAGSELNFHIAFAHLAEPIDIKLPKIDTRDIATLAGVRALLVGHGWPGIRAQDTDYEKAPKAAVHFPIDTVKNCLDRLFIIKEIDDVIAKQISLIKDGVTKCKEIKTTGSPCSGCLDLKSSIIGIEGFRKDIRQYLPLGENLPGLFLSTHQEIGDYLFESSKTSSLDLQKKLRAIASRGASIKQGNADSGSDLKSLLELKPYLCGECLDASLSELKLLQTAIKNSRTAGKKQENLIIAFPKIEKGDGGPEPMDFGAGVYTPSESGDELLLSGLVVGRRSHCFEHVSLGNFNTCSIPVISVSYVWPLFERLCLGQVVEPKAVLQVKDESKGASENKASHKKRQKNKKRKNKKRAQKKANAEKPIVVEEKEEPEGKESEDEEYESESEDVTPNISTLPITERLKGKVYSGLVTKRRNDGSPAYKELYTFVFNKRTSACMQYVTLMSRESILGDHVSNGSWRVEETPTSKRLLIESYIGPARKRILSFVFSIAENSDGSLVLREVRGQKKKETERNATGKTRSNISELRLIPRGTENPLSVFSLEETYCPEILTLSPPDYLRPSGTIRNIGERWQGFELEELCGTWDIAREARLSRRNRNGGTLGFERNGEGELVAFYKRQPYNVRVRQDYDLKDIFLRQPIYKLQLTPLDGNRTRSIVFGVYRHKESNQLYLCSSETRVPSLEQDTYDVLQKGEVFSKSN